MKRCGRKPPPEEVIQTAVAMYVDEGKTLKQIGAAFGKTRTWAWHVVRHRVPRKKQRLPRVTADQLAQAVAEYTAGATVEQAARAAGCSAYSAWKRLDQLGLIRLPNRRNARLDMPTAAAVRERVAEGLTPWEAARACGVKLAQVLQLLYGDAPTG